MNSHPTPLNVNGHRRRVGRPLALYTPPPDDRTAAAMDDEAAARRLVDDLLALVEAGLIVPIEDGEEVRYAPADADDPRRAWPPSPAVPAPRRHPIRRKARPERKRPARRTERLPSGGRAT